MFIFKAFEDFEVNLRIKLENNELGSRWSKRKARNSNVRFIFVRLPTSDV